MSNNVSLLPHSYSVLLPSGENSSVLQSLFPPINTSTTLRRVKWQTAKQEATISTMLMYIITCVHRVWPAQLRAQEWSNSVCVTLIQIPHYLPTAVVFTLVQVVWHRKTAQGSPPLKHIHTGFSAHAHSGAPNTSCWNMLSQQIGSEGV